VPDSGRLQPRRGKITGGYRLPARFIIHTVGPVWEGGDYAEADTLRSCYRESLALAAERALETVAFPCIATGVYEYPRELACEVAVETVRAWLESHELPRDVIFCCFDNADAEVYRERLSALGTGT
jgi:O-acetyl-ADP-ribose deacetylase (regulator of RNase III)